MQQLMQQTTTSMMSSREIAELCGKIHSHVLRDIREMIKQIGNPSLDYKQYQTLKDDIGRTASINLNKDLTMTLITGYRADIRYQVIKRWQELEQVAVAPVALPDFTNPAEAARAYADQYEAKKLAEDQLAIAQPKAAALDTLSHAKGSLGIRETAKAVGIPEREFITRCLDKSKPISSRFLYRNNQGRLNAHGHRIKQGFMTQKINSYTDQDGRDFARVEVKFTAAGVAHIAKLMQKKPSKQAEAI